MTGWFTVIGVAGCGGGLRVEHTCWKDTLVYSSACYVFRDSQRMPLHKENSTDNNSGMTKRCVDGSALAVGDSCQDDRDECQDDDFYSCHSSSRDIDSVLKWKWCERCQHRRPPRSHHCIICSKCILKRDHHCYMTGRCIGFANQRHFTVMNFYIGVSALGGLVLEFRWAECWWKNKGITLVQKVVGTESVTYTLFFWRSRDLKIENRSTH